MRFFSARNLAIFTALLLVGACDPVGSQGGMKVDNPVAIVNGYKVAPEIMDLYAEARTRQPFSQLGPEQKQEVLEEAVKLIAIAEEARSRGLQKDPEVAARIELQSMNVLAQSRIGQLVEDANIDEARLQAAYDAQYVTDPKQEYKARHILLKTEEEAQGVIKQLEGGADFAELAKEKSTGPSASNGGDLGWFSRDAMVQPFGDAVAGMAEGEFSKTPVQTQFGFHVILSEGSRSAPPPDFASVQESLRASVQQDLVQEFIEKTRAAAQVQILADLGQQETAQPQAPEPAEGADEPEDKE